MPGWSADSCIVDTQYPPWEMPISGPARAPSPWTTWCAQGLALLSGAVRVCSHPSVWSGTLSNEVMSISLSLLVYEEEMVTMPLLPVVIRDLSGSCM